MRSGEASFPPPPPPPPWPAGPSHSAAQRAVYTEAHQRTYTFQSGQGRHTQRKKIQVVILLKLRHKKRTKPQSAEWHEAKSGLD